MSEYHHVGVPTDTEHPGEQYLADAKLYITNPDDHPYRFEFLRFEPGSPLPEALKTRTHVAFRVDNLGDALQGEQVVIQPFEPMESLRVAFIMKDSVLIELMEMK